MNLFYSPDVDRQSCGLSCKHALSAVHILRVAMSESEQNFATAVAACWMKRRNDKNYKIHKKQQPNMQDHQHILLIACSL